MLFRRLLEDKEYAWRPGDDAHMEKLIVRFDGYPLAITLSAALLPMLSPATLEELLRRWETERVRAIQTGKGRMSSVAVSIELSYKMLSFDAKRLFALLSLFPAGATREALNQVVDFPVDAAASSLKTVSLAEEAESRLKISLDPIRGYAADCLDRAHGPRGYEGRATDYLEELVEREKDRLGRSGSGEALALLLVELPNVHAAIDRARARGDHRPALSLSPGLARVYECRGLLDLGSQFPASLPALP